MKERPISNDQAPQPTERRARRRKPNRKSNAPPGCVGLKLKLQAGGSFVWYGDDGYPVLQGYGSADGTMQLFALYLGDHHRSLTATEAHDEILHRLVVTGKSPRTAA